MNQLNILHLLGTRISLFFVEFNGTGQRRAPGGWAAPAAGLPGRPLPGALHPLLAPSLSGPGVAAGVPGPSPAEVNANEQKSLPSLPLRPERPSLSQTPT
jgi:hypothetical protein